MRTRVYEKTKKCLSAFLCIALVITLIPVGFGNSSAYGQVTNQSTDFTGYTAISTKAELNNVRNNLDGKYYLANDIVFTEEDFAPGGEFYNEGKGWIPIGTYEPITFSNTFKGTFDGNGKSISGIVVNSDSNAGLFGCVTGKVCNLTMLNGSIQSITTGENEVAKAGGIAADCRGDGVIENCYNECTVLAKATSSGASAMAGGIVGHTSDPVSNGTVLIKNCGNGGQVTSEVVAPDRIAAVAGGVVGLHQTGNIEYCYNRGEVIGTHAGGVTGRSEGYAMTKSYNSGEIFASVYGGGLIGYNYHCDISDSYNSGLVEGDSTAHAGGICGYAQYSEITRCYNLGGTTKSSVDYMKLIGGTSSGTDAKANFHDCYALDIYFGAKTYPEVSGVKVLNAEEVRQSGNYANFDFTDVWECDSTAEYPFPQIKGLRHANPDENTMEFAGGIGSLESPFIIATKEHLDNVRNYSSAFFILKNNIAFSESDFQNDGEYYNEGYGWKPIGRETNGNFTGYFEGNGYTISGIVVEVSSSEMAYAGIFSFNCGTIRNLGVSSGTVVATTTNQSTNAYAGGIAARNIGLVENCYNASSVKSTSKVELLSANLYAGGIIGEGTGTIRNCYNIGKIYAEGQSYYDMKHVGGIAGSVKYSGVLKSCYNIGKCSISGQGKVAEIVSSSGNDDITNCYYEGSRGGLGTGSSVDTSSGISMLLINDMTKQESFQGFDFDSVWEIDENSTYLLPQLKTVPMVVESVSLEMNMNNETLSAVGKQLSLSLHMTTSQNIAENWIIFSSDNEDVATINEKGILTGVGVGTANITAKSIYGNVVASGVINVQDNIATFEITGVVDKSYTGKTITQDIVVKKNGVELKENTDYTLRYYNNEPGYVGNAGVVISGMGSYNGSVNMPFTITQASIASMSINLAYTSTYFDGTDKKPTVTIDGLVEGQDYTVTYRNNMHVGTATVTVTGQKTCYGSKTANFNITNPRTQTYFGSANAVRIYGSTRYDTAILSANALKKTLGVSKFDCIIVADGRNYADALSGGYLAKVKNAPILVVGNDSESQTKIINYIRSNLNSGGKIYILGGPGSVSQGFQNSLSGYNVTRLGGSTRLDTNLAILYEAGVTNEDILICSGYGFADSLSASAVGKPILLVDRQLTSAQKSFLQHWGSDKIYIVGGTGSVYPTVESEARAFGTIKRVSGADRYATSVAVANEFFTGNSETITLAYGQNFPDGLSGAPLAMSLDAPLILATSLDTKAAANYSRQNGKSKIVTLGGPTLISDSAASNVLLGRA